MRPMLVEQHTLHPLDYAGITDETNPTGMSEFFVNEVKDLDGNHAPDYSHLAEILLKRFRTVYPSIQSGDPQFQLLLHEVADLAMAPDVPAKIQGMLYNLRLILSAPKL